MVHSVHREVAACRSHVGETRKVLYPKLINAMQPGPVLGCLFSSSGHQGHQPDSPICSLWTTAVCCHQSTWCQFPREVTPQLESLCDPVAPVPQLLIRPMSALVLLQVILQHFKRKFCSCCGYSQGTGFSSPAHGQERARLLLFLDVMILSARSLPASSTKGFSVVL